MSTGQKTRRKAGDGPRTVTRLQRSLTSSSTPGDELSSRQSKADGGCLPIEKGDVGPCVEKMADVLKQDRLSDDEKVSEGDCWDSRATRDGEGGPPPVSMVDDMAMGVAVGVRVTTN